MYIGDLGELRRAMPAVDRQGQRAPYPGIVERFAFMVRLNETAAIPVALLHRNLAVQCIDELIAHRGRKTTELDRGTVRANGIEPYRCFSA